MVACYTAAYQHCGGISAQDTDPCVIQGLEACKHAVTCATTPCTTCSTSTGESPSTLSSGSHGSTGSSATASTYPGTYRIDEKVHIASSCNPWREMLQRRITAAVDRLQNCLNYGFVRPALAEAVIRALTEGDGVLVLCQEPPNPHWCAAGGVGEVWFSPTKALQSAGICYPDIEGFFVHEVAHSANLRTAPTHNESGESTEYDEVYSLQRYCTTRARMWIGRAHRTGDVVDSDHLACVRAYQELTPSTDEDPFWLAMARKAKGGHDPCAPPLPQPP
jgi:hypothetical protein